MKINSSKISALIKKQIENFNLNIEADDVGNVVTVGDGVALVYCILNGPYARGTCIIPT